MPIKIQKSKIKNQKWIAWGTLLALACGLSTGCGLTLVGSWKMVEALPNRETFCIDNVRFTREETYSAVVTIEGNTITEKGHYSFNGFTIKFMPSNGGMRSYTGVLKVNEFEILDGARKVVLEKQ